MKSAEQFQMTMGQHLVFATFLSAQFSSSDNSSDIAIPAALKSAANLGWELLLMPDRSKVASPAARFEGGNGRTCNAGHVVRLPPAPALGSRSR